MKFYTSVHTIGNKIAEIGYENGKRFERKVDFTPSLYIPTNKKNTGLKTLNGAPVEPLSFPNLKEAREFVYKNQELPGFRIFGDIQFEYQYIHANYPGQIAYDFNSLRVAIIDIEVASENGFPLPSEASEVVTAITVLMEGKYHVWGLKPYSPSDPNVTYYECDDEESLLDSFTTYWCSKYPDVITGWNVSFFDMPYLYNRLNRLFGAGAGDILSPWRKIKPRIAIIKGKEQEGLDIYGIPTLDYLELYRKLTQNEQDSYKLDNIAHVELKEKKLSFDEYSSLSQLYRADHQKFMDYNIKDVTLVHKLDKKLKMIELVLNQAYYAKCNYLDTFKQVRMWDILIYNYLLDRGVVVPPRKSFSKEEKYEGAYVKEIKPGMYEWIASLDLQSLYPSLIRQYNISPETLVHDTDETISIADILNGGFKNTSKYSMTANGKYFRKDIRGFLPNIMEDLFNERKMYKDRATEAEKILQDVKKELSSRGVKV